MAEVNKNTVMDVVYGDAVAWLRDHVPSPGESLFTSLPDPAELSLGVDAWEAFFVDAAEACFGAVPPEGAVVFLQTDKRVAGRWISKAGLLLGVAARLGVPLIFHKIVLRHPAGLVAQGRPTYSHLMGFSALGRMPDAKSTADVIAVPGAAAWSHGMGAEVAKAALTAISAVAPGTRRLLAPFCGLGEALMAAQAAGFDGVGVERNRKRAEHCRARLRGEPLMLRGRGPTGAGEP